MEAVTERGGNRRRRRGRVHVRAFIFAHEGMSYKLTSNDIAQIAGFSATVFAAVFAYFKGRID